MRTIVLVVGLIVIYCALIQFLGIQGGLSTNPTGPVPVQFLPGPTYAPVGVYAGTTMGANPGMFAGSYVGVDDIRKMNVLQRMQLLSGQAQTLPSY